MMPENISSSTVLYGIFGDPVGHSLSPAMHNQAFVHINENAVYLAFCVKEIGPAIDAVRALGMGGASVTIPHKVSVIKYLDEIDGNAKQMGAVNTIINDNGRLVGKNSDCDGAVKAIEEKTDLYGKNLVVLGAGGAARAIGFGAKQKGAKIVIANRTRDKAKALASELGVEFIPLDSVCDISCDILINATSVGMAPNIKKSPVPEIIFKSGMVVMDIVYRPLNTLFLTHARKKGCEIIDGVSMFVNQGSSQFEWWTKKPAPVQVMRKTVEDILNKA